MNFFKSLKKLFKTGFFHIFGSSIINKVIGFLSAVVLVRVLTKSEYGIFTYAWNIYSLILILSGFGITSGVLQACSEKHSEEKKENFFHFGFLYGTGVNLILGFVMLIIGWFGLLKLSSSNTLLCILFLLPVLTFWFDMQCVRQRTEYKNQQFAVSSMLNVILVFVFSAAGAWLGKEAGLIAGRYVATALSVIFLLVIFRTPIGLRKSDSISRQEKKDLLKLSTISMVNNGLSQLLYLIDVFVIGLVVSDETIIASYKVATQIPTALAFIPSAIVVYVYPYFASHNQDKKWCLRKYKQLLAGMGALNLVISGMLFILAPFIVSVVFGKQYLDAVVPFRILSVSYFFSGTFRVIAGNILVTQRRLMFNMFVAIFSGVVNIAADYIFIMNWGSNGAAVATLLVVIITSVMNVAYLLFVLSKKRKM